MQVTDGVILEPVLRRHNPAFCEAILDSKDSLRRWITWVGPFAGLADGEAWADRSFNGRAAGKTFNYLLVSESDGAVLGGCGLMEINPNNRSAFFGYWLREGQRGRGLAQKANQCLVLLAFGRLAELQVVECAPDVVGEEVVPAPRLPELKLNRLVLEVSEGARGVGSGFETVC